MVKIIIFIATIWFGAENIIKYTKGKINGYRERNKKY